MHLLDTQISIPTQNKEISGLFLKKISIPTFIQNIESSSFNGCSNLTKVSIHSSAKKICHSAFKECISLKQISIPLSAKSMECDVFFFTL